MSKYALDAKRPRLKEKSATQADVGTSALDAIVTFAYAEPGSSEITEACERLRKSLPVIGLDSGFALEARRAIAGARDDEPLRRQLCASFERYLDQTGTHRNWSVPGEVFPLEVTSMDVVIKAGSLRPGGAIYSGPSAFWFVIASLMGQTLQLLARCVECRRPFVRVRRQEFCGKACGQRVRSRRWYQAHSKEAAERKHDAYVRRLHQAHPKAKATRRARRRSP